MSYQINNFNGGEIGDQLKYRADLQKYPSSCLKLENFLPTPWGGIENRPGMLCIANIPAGKIKLIPFEYSVEYAYIIVASDKLFSIYRNDEFVAAVVTPYLEDELDKLNFTQSNDILFIAHPNHTPAMLKRMTASNFVYEPMTFRGGPYQDEDDRGITLTLSGSTVTASAGMFDNSMIGSCIRFAAPLVNNTINETFDQDNHSQTSSAITHRGSWSVATYGTWIGTLKVEQSTDNGSSWHHFRSYKVNADRNISDTGFEEEKAMYRMKYSGWQNAPEGSIYECRASFQSESYESYGVLQIASIISATQATVTVLENCPASTSDTWSLSAWSDATGYPALVSFTSGDRLAFARTRKEPNRVWLSKVGDYNNFFMDVEADSAVMTTIKVGTGIGNVTGNAITFIANRKTGLVIGSWAEIGTLAARKSDEPLGPDNIIYTPEINPGAAEFPPVQVNDCLMFIRRGAENLLELSYNYSTDGFVAPDMTVTHPDILKNGGGVKEMVYVELPFPIFYLLLNDGSLVSFTYNRTENVTAWSRHPTAGKILSIARIATSDGHDILHIAVERENGRFLERLTYRNDSSGDVGVWFDNATMLEDDSAAPVGFTGFSGLTRFAGLTMPAKLDGEKVDLIFDEYGNADFGKTVQRASVGYSYTSVCTPVPMEVSDRINSSFSAKKRVPTIMLKFRNTLGGSVQIGNAREIPVIFRRVSDLNRSMTLKSGTFVVDMPDKWDYEKTVTIRQDLPWAMTLQAVIMENE